MAGASARQSMATIFICMPRALNINAADAVTPTNIISQSFSAELRPGQKDSDSLPEYDILDPLLYQYIERRQGPNEIKAMSFDAALVDRVLRLVNINQYKRNQFCSLFE